MGAAVSSCCCGAGVVLLCCWCDVGVVLVRCGRGGGGAVLLGWLVVRLGDTAGTCAAWWQWLVGKVPVMSMAMVQPYQQPYQHRF